MSRSYRKHPRCVDHKGRDKKRVAWKTVRQWLKDNPEMSLNGSQYKKIYESWKICDCSMIEIWKEFLEEATRLNEEKSPEKVLDKKQIYRKWYTAYKRK